jgi:hypothetical protein
VPLPKPPKPGPDGFAAGPGIGPGRPDLVLGIRVVPALIVPLVLIES